MTLVRFVFLWAALIFGVPILLVWIGLPKDFVVWISSGLAFGAIAHFSQSPYWKYLSKKELNPFSSRYGQSSEPKPEARSIRFNLSGLDMPLKRVAFLTMILGIATCLLTFVIYETNEGWDFDFLVALFKRRYSYWSYKTAMLVGLTLSAAGYLCAFHYEATVGRLVAWVRTGKTRS